MYLMCWCVYQRPIMTSYAGVLVLGVLDVLVCLPEAKHDQLCWCACTWCAWCSGVFTRGQACPGGETGDLSGSRVVLIERVTSSARAQWLCTIWRLSEEDTRQTCSSQILYKYWECEMAMMSRRYQIRKFKLLDKHSHQNGALCIYFTVTVNTNCHKGIDFLIHPKGWVNNERMAKHYVCGQ